MSDNNKFWLKFKKVFIKIAMVLALLSLIYGTGHLVVNDIPTTIRGYQEIQTSTKTVMKEVSFSDALVMIINDLSLIILSGAVLIFVFDPAYKQSELFD